MELLGLGRLRDKVILDALGMVIEGLGLKARWGKGLILDFLGSWSWLVWL